MNCTRTGCGGRLRVSHTYTGPRVKYQRAACEACGRVHCLETTVAVVAGRGDGARARARRAALRDAPTAGPGPRDPRPPA